MMEYTYKSRFGYLSLLKEESKFKDLIDFFSKKSDEELHKCIETNNTQYNILKNINRREEEHLRDLRIRTIKSIHSSYSIKDIQNLINKYKKNAKFFSTEKLLIENQIRWRRKVIFALSNIIKSRKLEKDRCNDGSIDDQKVADSTVHQHIFEESGHQTWKDLLVSKERETEIDSTIKQLESALREAEERYAGEEFKKTTNFPNSVKELIDNFDDRIKKLESKIETLSHLSCSQEIVISTYNKRIEECIKSIENNRDLTDKRIKEVLKELKSLEIRKTFKERL